MHIFKSSYFYGIGSLLMLYPTLKKGEDTVKYMKLEDKAIHAGHNNREINQVANTVVNFYDSRDKAIAQELKSSVENNQALADTTYTVTFTANLFAAEDDAEHIELRQIIKDAQESEKKSILFSYQQKPTLNFQMSLASAKHMQEKHDDLKDKLNLDQGIPLYISSSQEREAYAEHKASGLAYDRWTVISVANLASKSLEEMDFTIGHEAGHHKQSSRKGTFQAIADNLKDFVMTTFKFDDQSDPTRYFFTKSKLDELEADSIGAKYSSFKSAVKCMTSFDFDKHKKSLSVDDVVNTLRDDETLPDSKATHPPTYLRLREIHRIYNKL